MLGNGNLSFSAAIFILILLFCFLILLSLTNHSYKKIEVYNDYILYKGLFGYKRRILRTDITHYEQTSFINRIGENMLNVKICYSDKSISIGNKQYSNYSELRETLTKKLPNKSGNRCQEVEEQSRKGVSIVLLLFMIGSWGWCGYELISNISSLNRVSIIVPIFATVLFLFRKRRFI